MKRIAIFSSGTGSNARNIIQYFHHHPEIKVECIICNNPKARVLDVASEWSIPAYLISKDDLYQNNKVSDILQKNAVDLIVLAGFLWLVPETILRTYQNRIINIHPALLPKHGGAGMYGRKVHQSVIDSGERKSGISIHFLNEKYDEGEIVFQKEIPVDKSDTPETLAARIHQLEYEWYPKIIEKLLLGKY